NWLVFIMIFAVIGLSLLQVFWSFVVVPGAELIHNATNGLPTIASPQVAPAPVPQYVPQSAPSRSLASDAAAGATSTGFWLGEWLVLILAAAGGAWFIKSRRWWFAAIFLRIAAVAVKRYTLRSDQFRATLSYPAGSPAIQTAVF